MYIGFIYHRVGSSDSKKVKVKLFHYTPRRRLGGEEV